MRIVLFIALMFTTLVWGQAQQPAAAPTGGSPAYRAAQMLPPRILSFEAQPSSIQPGQSVLLTWAAENPTGVAIDPGVGPVRPRGSRQLTPAQTTTYTLTVKGPANAVLTRSVTVTVAGTVAAKAAPAENAKKEVPKTADGKPDLSGVYDFARQGGRAAGVVTPAPLKPGAEKFKVVRGPTDPGLYANCMPTGVPGAFSVPYQFQIIQGATHLAILHEYPNIFRIIPINGPTNGGAHPADPDPTWMGDSIGHWEGDTLVVDTAGFNDKTELPGGFRHTEALHVVERIRRPDFETLEYQATIEDPNVFEKPWTINRIFPLRRDLNKIDEFICENNPDYSKLFKKE